jgi:hypothetical protein
VILCEWIAGFDTLLTRGAVTSGFQNWFSGNLVLDFPAETRSVKSDHCEYFK